MDAIAHIENGYLKESLPEFVVGDTVDVHVRITEGEKERIQIFTGTVIAIRGEGTRKMFTVRRIVQSEGVERTFPLHSPRIADVQVKRPGAVRRAKLYYLRKRRGKATRVKERIVDMGRSKKKTKKTKGKGKNKG